MARIIGGLTTSHVPVLGRVIEEKQQQDPKWKPFFDGFDPLQRWVAREKPDVVVEFCIDHGLNFFLDKMPTFAVGAAHDYRNDDEGWGPPRPRVFKGDAKLSWHIIGSLVADEFDVTTCQEMVLDHGCTIALDMVWPDGWPVALVPVMINIVQHPLPTLKRCFKLGQAVGRAIKSYPRDIKVLVVGSGGLSHQIRTAGFINEEFDRLCMDKIVSDPDAMTRYGIEEFVELAGSQGLEFVTWLGMRGALSGDVSVVTTTYHNPLSHTGGAIMLLEPRG
jgi:protocatechuate 4,5-dioxygenase beta chain